MFLTTSHSCPFLNQRNYHLDATPTRCRPLPQAPRAAAVRPPHCLCLYAGCLRAGCAWPRFRSLSPSGKRCKICFPCRFPSLGSRVLPSRGRLLAQEPQLGQPVSQGQRWVFTRSRKVVAAPGGLWGGVEGRRQSAAQSSCLRGAQ